MTYLYTRGSYYVRYSAMRDRYIVCTAHGPIGVLHSDYPANDDGLQLAKACADLQAQFEEEILR